MPDEQAPAAASRRVAGGATVTYSAPQPVTGVVELAMPIDRLWEVFANVPGWPDWNRSFRWARVTGGVLRQGAMLYWSFNPIRPRYPYRMPALARIVECEPRRRVTWEVKAPGFHAFHSYLFEGLDAERSLFGSWEAAEGPSFMAMRRFWLAHFDFVCRESLAGARRLALSGRSAQTASPSTKLTNRPVSRSGGP